jgi:hypothetical protein
MERRTFLGVIAGGPLTSPLAAEAQPAGTPSRIGVLLNLYPPNALCKRTHVYLSWWRQAVHTPG